MAVPSRIPVAHGLVFPAGAYAVDVVAVQEWDEQSRRVLGQAVDSETRDPLWTVVVHDPDPVARSHEVRVKIASAIEPVLPPQVDGHPLRPVVFESLTVTPYLDANARRPRVAYSLRAAGLHGPDPVAGSSPPGGSSGRSRGGSGGGSGGGSS